jgi:hypothetical protein
MHERKSLKRKTEKKKNKKRDLNFLIFFWFRKMEEIFNFV